MLNTPEVGSKENMRLRTSSINVKKSKTIVIIILAKRNSRGGIRILLSKLWQVVSGGLNSK
ncbi:hypothetical protein DXZ79_08810 [Yersinia rochesterensis]|uniref:Uncharacterized protein n=1 Tax=Yersinia rochesterensis TaxID=1604335 RepID=A0A8D4N5N8_9GAMM|nr:hypothetical protein DXZ79_08810 [Yersinia rochesterensis]